MFGLGHGHHTARFTLLMHGNLGFCLNCHALAQVHHIFIEKEEKSKNFLIDFVIIQVKRTNMEEIYSNSKSEKKLCEAVVDYCTKNKEKFQQFELFPRTRRIAKKGDIRVIVLS